MTTVAIPHRNALGLLPPIDPDRPASADRSPYRVSLPDVVQRFATSPDRCQILSGLLAYRAALHGIGVISGFQWLDGSFMENVERIEGRPPHDLDVVTFAETRAVTRSPEAALVFNHDRTKARFGMDAYVVDLDGLVPSKLTTLAAYWYSMWSHRRNQAWKGYLQVELSPSEDARAAALLLLIAPAKETP
jgi:hypothetical protein